MSSRVLFYISGHGYGHARRCTQVIRALRDRHPAVEVFVRTTAPARIFAGLVPADRVTPTDADAGAAERSPLEVDPAGTLDRVEAAIARRPAVVAAELPIVARIKPGLIVADAPFLAGDVAGAAGVPCVAMTNFSWDWIVEPFVRDLRRSSAILDEVGASYAKMAGLLRMPLGGVSAAFRKVRDVPLVANQSRRDPAEVLERLGVDSKDGRRRILFGVRGAIPTATLAAAAADAPDLFYVCPTNEPGDVPPGVLPAAIGGGGTDAIDFSDVLSVCDVVIGKMGYGLVAECIASGVALLWPRRTGFREDEVVERNGPRVMRMRELPLDDFHAGRWAEHTRAAAALPPAAKVLRADGAEVCADWIAENARH